jgi:hypothetical protein
MMSKGELISAGEVDRCRCGDLLLLARMGESPASSVLVRTLANILMCPEIVGWLGGSGTLWGGGGKEDAGVQGNLAQLHEWVWHAQTLTRGV